MKPTERNAFKISLSHIGVSLASRPGRRYVGALLLGASLVFGAVPGQYPTFGLFETPAAHAQGTAPSIFQVLALDVSDVISNLVCNPDGTVASVDVSGLLPNNQPFSFTSSTNVAVAECAAAAAASAGNDAEPLRQGNNRVEGLDPREVANTALNSTSLFQQTGNPFDGLRGIVLGNPFALDEAAAEREADAEGDFKVNRDFQLTPPPFRIGGDDETRSVARDFDAGDPGARQPNVPVNPGVRLFLENGIVNLKQKIEDLKQQQIAVEQIFNNREIDFLEFAAQIDQINQIIAGLEENIDAIEVALLSPEDRERKRLLEQQQVERDERLARELEQAEIAGQQNEQDRAADEKRNAVLREQLQDQIAFRKKLIEEAARDLEHLALERSNFEFDVALAKNTVETHLDLNVAWIPDFVEDVVEEGLEFFIGDPATGSFTTLETEKKLLKNLSQDLRGVEAQIEQRRQDIKDQTQLLATFRNRLEALGAPPAQHYTAAAMPDAALSVINALWASEPAMITAFGSGRPEAAGTMKTPPRFIVVPTRPVRSKYESAQNETVRKGRGNLRRATPRELQLARQQIAELHAAFEKLLERAVSARKSIRQGILEADAVLGAPQTLRSLYSRKMALALTSRKPKVILRELNRVIDAYSTRVGELENRVRRRLQRPASGRNSRHSVGSRARHASAINTTRARSANGRRTDARSSSQSAQTSSFTATGNSVNKTGFFLDIDQALRQRGRFDERFGIAMAAIDDPLARWNIDISGDVTRFNDSAVVDRDGLLFTLQGRAAYQLTKRLVVGGHATYKNGNVDSGVVQSELNANTIGFGLFSRADIYRGLLFDMAINYEHGFNNFTLAGDVSDFGSDVLTAGTRLTKRFNFDGNLWLEPNVAVSYSKSRNASFTSAAGIAAPSATFEQGRVSFGPRIGKTFDVSENKIVAGDIFLGLNGLFDFISEADSSLVNGAVASDPTNGVQVNGGFGLTWANGWQTSANVSYVHLDTLDSVGGTLNLTLPLGP